MRTGGKGLTDKQIEQQLAAARKRRGRARRELEAAGKQLVKQLLRQRLAGHEGHAKLMKDEAVLRRNLHQTRIKRARKRQSIEAARRRIRDREHEIDELNKVESKQVTEMEKLTVQIDEIAAKCRRQIEQELENN